MRAATHFACALVLLGCSRQDGNLPVGEDGPSVVEQERYLRRLHIDLAGTAPSDATLQAGVQRLASEGNLAATRRTLAKELMQLSSFAEVFVGELSNRALEGESVEARIDFACAVFRVVQCNNECGEPPAGDPCASCNCDPIPQLVAEREDLLKTTADFAQGASSSSIERRYGRTSAFRFPLAPEGVAERLFEAFLGRPVEAEEQRNAAAMVFGSFIPNSPAGLLFHRHGANYQELIDIVFTSEPYRDAAVDGVFLRYLGRRASPAELHHFSASLDAANPDVRGVIEAVVSSQEYFDQ